MAPLPLSDSRALHAPGSAMHDVDTLLECRWMAPVRPAGLVLEDHAIAIDKGRIVAMLVRRGTNSLYIPFRVDVG